MVRWFGARVLSQSQTTLAGHFDLAARVARLEHRVDQAVNLERFPRRDARFPVVVDGVQEVAPHGQVMIVREGHGVGAAAAGTTAAFLAASGMTVMAGMTVVAAALVVRSAMAQPPT